MKSSAFCTRGANKSCRCVSAPATGPLAEVRRGSRGNNCAICLRRSGGWVGEGNAFAYPKCPRFDRLGENSGRLRRRWLQPPPSTTSACAPCRREHAHFVENGGASFSCSSHRDTGNTVFFPRGLCGSVREKRACCASGRPRSNAFYIPCNCSVQRSGRENAPWCHCERPQGCEAISRVAWWGIATPPEFTLSLSKWRLAKPFGQVQAEQLPFLVCSRAAELQRNAAFFCYNGERNYRWQDLRHHAQG